MFLKKWFKQIPNVLYTNKKGAGEGRMEGGGRREGGAGVGGRVRWRGRVPLKIKFLIEAFKKLLEWIPGRHQLRGRGGWWSHPLGYF
jgi:hypothetical protein